MVKRIVLALLMIGLFAACEEIDQTNEDITQEAATESPGDDVAPIRHVKTIKSFYESDCYEQISIDSATITYDGKNRVVRYDVDSWNAYVFMPMRQKRHVFVGNNYIVKRS